MIENEKARLEIRKLRVRWRKRKTRRTVGQKWKGRRMGLRWKKVGGKSVEFWTSRGVEAPSPSRAPVTEDLLLYKYKYKSSDILIVESSKECRLLLLWQLSTLPRFLADAMFVGPEVVSFKLLS